FHVTGVQTCALPILLGLGSTLAMLRMPYGSDESVKFTEEVVREMAVEGWRQSLALAEEKGPAPIMEDEFEVTPKMISKCPDLAKIGRASCRERESME